jgi:hypothetical protein
MFNMKIKRNYQIFGEMNADKFMDFMIDMFDNMGMNRPGYEMELPINCTYCPFHKECTEHEDEDISCLEFLLTKLK